MAMGHSVPRVAFAGVQAIGIICLLVWKSTPSAASVLWGVSLIALFPGEFPASMLTERLLWKSQLSSAEMLAVEVAITVAINAAFWFAAIHGARIALGRRARS